MKPPSLRIRSAIACIAVVLAGLQHACRDTPTAPQPLSGTVLSAEINAPGDEASPEAIFLAPLGPKRHPRGVLDTTLAPAVSICRLRNDACVDTLALFTSDSSADSTRRVELNERAYFVRWKLNALPADPAVTYRVTITLGDTTAGYTDVRIVAPEFRAAPEDTTRYAFITERNRLNVKFQIFVLPVTLTVITEPGVYGNLASDTYSFRRGERVAYEFAADSGYRNALVTLDETPIPKRGRITMDDSHVLIASADRVATVAPGDEWILQDSRSLLKTKDKIKAAQQLLSKLNDISDTTGIVERLRRVEMTVLQRDVDAGALAALGESLANHALDVGGGDGAADAPPTGGGGGVASALMIPLRSPESSVGRPAATVMTQGPGAAEPVTIVYVNGILTTPLGALFAAHHVAVAAREARWNANVPFEVKLMYNRSAMAGEASEEERCVLGVGVKGDWLGLNSLPAEVAKCIAGTEVSTRSVLADFLVVSQQFASVLKRSVAVRPLDADSIAALTQRLRDQGRHVVFVMHSRGNLTVQEGLTILAQSGKYNQARDTTCIGGVALAAPTSEAWPIAGRHLRGLNVEGDAILTLGRNKFPQVRTSLSDSAGRVSIFWRVLHSVTGLSSVAQIRWALRLHGVVESYFGQEPMRTRIKQAIVSSYRSCGIGAVEARPNVLTLHPGETGIFQADLRDLEGGPLDGRRGITWIAESGSDWQRAVQLSATGSASARYTGGTSVAVKTRNLIGTAGIAVDPTPIAVGVTESLTARWVTLWLSESKDIPIPPFIIPETSWDGGSCAENAEFSSNGRTGTFTKECTADYRVTVEPVAGAQQYVATFFEKGGTTAKFSVTGATGSLHGWTGGPLPNLDHLPGPVPMDRVSVTAFDAGGHLLASGTKCLRGCVGWSEN